MSVDFDVMVRRYDMGGQGRIQDLSEGGGQDFFRNKKMNNYEPKILPQAKIFFDLKDSKTVKIND